MVASEAGDESEVMRPQDVGSAAYLSRHSTQMFEEGRSFSGNERDKLWFNRGNSWFEDLSDLSGADDPNDGRAVLATDFDDDGDVDLFVHNLQRERHKLYRNDLGTTHGGFVKIQLQATNSHYEAIGAKVIVYGPDGPTAQVLSRGAGFGSCQAPELVFGIGDARKVRVAVSWPGGVQESFGNVKASSKVLLVETLSKPDTLVGRPHPFPDPKPLGLRVAEGDRLPAFLALDKDGEETVVDIAKLSGGKTVYLNFWASYCVPCIKELPTLEAMNAEGDVRVIGLSTDAPADLHSAFDRFEARGATFPTFFLGAEESGDAKAASVRDVIDLERLPIPTTLVIGADGTVQRVIRGPLPE